MTKFITAFIFGLIGVTFDNYVRSDTSKSNNRKRVESTAVLVCTIALMLLVLLN